MSRLLRYLYTFFFSIALLFALVKMALRHINDHDGHRKAGPRRRFFERFGLLGGSPPKNGVIFHMVSVGETIAALRLLEQFISAHPDTPVTVTCTTATASRLISQRLGERVHHCYLPFDLPIFVWLFLKRLQPRALIILETELWPNLSYACAKRNVALLLLNARLSDKSFKGYRKVRPLTAATINHFSAICCQGEQDARHFLDLGLAKEKCHNIGNLKFDISPSDDLAEKAQTLHQSRLQNRPTWVAASTHPGEEEIVIASHQQLLKTHPDLVLVLVPRHPQRSTEVAQLLKSAELGYIKHSDNRSIQADDQVYIVDTIGELMTFYALSQVCFVAGSLVPHGGHNPLEPAMLHKAIISGKHVHNFTKIYTDLEQSQAVIMIDNTPEALSHSVAQLLDDTKQSKALGDNAAHYLQSHQGAIAASLEKIEIALAISELH